MKKVLALLLALVLVVGAFASCSSETASDEASGSEEGGVEPVRFGVSYFATGSNAENGEVAKISLEIAQDEINEAGGINGRPVELVFMDVKSDAKESPEVARKFVEDESILAVIAGDSSAGCMAAAPVYQDAGLIQIASNASAVDYPPMGDYQFSLVGRSSEDIPYGVENVIAGQLQAKTIALIYQNDEWGNSYVESYESSCAENGIEIVAAEPYMVGDQDFNAVLSKLRQADPDVLALCCQYAEGSLIMKQIRQMGWDDVRCVCSGGLVNDMFLDVVGEDGEGVIGWTIYAYSEDYPAAYAFAEEYRARSGGKNPSNWGGMYDVLHILANAAIDCGDDLTRATLRDSLAAQDDFVTMMGGNLKFNDDGSVSREYYPLVIKDGEWVAYTGE